MSLVLWQHCLHYTLSNSPVTARPLGTLLTEDEREETVHPLRAKNGLCEFPHTLRWILVLLEHGAALQRLCGWTVLEDIVIETSQLLSHVLGSPPPWAAVLHRKQLGAKVVEPQYVGMRVVSSPVIPDKRHKQHERINKSTTMLHFSLCCHEL